MAWTPIAVIVSARSKKLVQDSDVEVHALGIFDAGRFDFIEESFGRRSLNKITEAAGGRTITVDQASRIPAAAAEISQEIRSRYLLGYRPIATSGESIRRKIRVDVISQAGPLPLHTHYESTYRTTD